jgi:D-alanyl-D-alanine carboxypeptidase
LAVGAAAATVAGGAIDSLSGAGSRDARTRVPVTVETRFAVASLTKVVTALSALSVAADGRVDLDEPVRSLLRRWDLRPLPSGVTLRRLLGHTAGMPSGVSPARAK